MENARIRPRSPQDRGETIGYIVIETNVSGSAEIEGLPYVAALGGDTINGVGDSPAYSYTYNAMTNSKTAVASQAAMDGGNGGWAVLYGDNPITNTGNTLKLAIDEDQNKDSERRHTSEQVAYLIIDPPLHETIVSPVLVPMAARKSSSVGNGIHPRDVDQGLMELLDIRSTPQRVQSFGDACPAPSTSSSVVVLNAEAIDEVVSELESAIASELSIAP